MTGQLYDTDGQVVGEIELDDAVFAGEIHASLMHQLLECQLANKRLGTASTLSRGEVRGSTAKPWRQKGTGNARAGHRRSPIWRTGGVVFGPRPRSFRQRMPQKMRCAAYRSLFSFKCVQEQCLRVVVGFPSEFSKTKELVQVLSKLSLKPEERAVVIYAGENKALSQVAKNIANLELLNCKRLLVHPLLYAHTVILTQEAAQALPELLCASKGKGSGEKEQPKDEA